jgi:hypothetical protein
VKLLFLVTLLAGAQNAAAATPPPCLTREEFADMSMFMLPAVLEGVAARCQAFLPAQAYLLNRGKARAARLASDGEAHKEGAIAAFAKIGQGKMPEGLSADTMAGFVRDMAKAELFKKFTAADCAKADETAELLDPLPLENLAGLVRLLIEFGGKEGKGPPLRFCPAAAQ